MTGLVAGIGFKVLAGRVLGGAAAGAKGAAKWLGSLDLVHVLLFVLALFGAWQTFGRWAQHRHTVKVEGQLTAANHALITSRANVQTLKVALAKQNAAVAELGSKSAGQQKIAAKASQVAAGRANEAQATSERLRQSSRSAPLKSASAAPCEPSQTLKDQWK